MSLVEHAERELKIAGMFDEDSDYGGDVGVAVLELMRVFAEQGHSGGSAYVARELFYKLSQFKSLTPLTDDPSEWMDVGPDPRGTCFQSRRQPCCFSYDGGKTYYSLEEEGRPMHESKTSRT